MEVNSNPTGETSGILTTSQASQEAEQMSGVNSSNIPPVQSSSTSGSVPAETEIAEQDTTIADADEIAMFSTTLDNIISSGPSTVNDTTTDEEKKKNDSNEDYSITAEEVRNSLENQAKNAEMYAKGQSDKPETFSSRFYEEENKFEGASKSTEDAFNKTTAAIKIGSGSGNRAYDRITANGGTMKNVIDYLETLEDNADVKAKELDKLGREYYDAAAGDIRAGLEVFSKTGDIIGKGTAEKIMGAIELANEGDFDAAAAMLDSKNVKITENLFSILWKNNEANKTLIGLGATELAGLAAGKLISKAGEAIIPKAVDKLISIATNSKNEKVAVVAEKILGGLAKNQKIRNSLKNEKLIEIYEKELSNPAKTRGQVARFSSVVDDAVKSGKPFDGTVKLGDARVIEEAVSRGLVKAKDLAVAAGEAASISPKTVGAGAAIGAAGEAAASPVLPKQAETIAEQAPTGVVEKFEEKNKKFEDVDAGDAKDVVSDYMSNIEAKKENEEMAFAESKKSAGDIVRNAYSNTNTEMPDYVKQIADKMDDIHNSEMTEIEKEAAYKNLYGEYDISQILKDLGIPVVSSTLKAIDAWKNGDWNLENKRSGSEFAEVTKKLKEAWNEGGFFNRIKSTIDAAKGYKEALQNTKMYTALKATQKAVGEFLISALGIPAASIAPFMLILGKNIISNALKSASNGETSLDDISSEEFYNSFDTTGEEETEAPEFSKKWDENAIPEDAKGYNAGLEEEEKARKELPSDAFVKIIYRKEPWIRKFRI